MSRSFSALVLAGAQFACSAPSSVAGNGETVTGDSVILDNPKIFAGSDENALPLPRTRSSLNDAWRFTRGDPAVDTSSLAYTASRPWVLPTGNAFIKDPSQRAAPPRPNLGEAVPLRRRRLRRQRLAQRDSAARLRN
jgi:hypothetical protein